MRTSAVLLFGFVLAHAVSAVGQDNDRCPSQAFDRAPILLSDPEPLKAAVRSAGHEGRVVLRVTVTESGDARDPRIISPPRLSSVPKILDEIRAWRLCPAVKLGRFQATAIEYSLEVRSDL
jgi:hypothetical protein